MSGEILRADWPEVEAQHPEFQELRLRPFAEVLIEAADELVGRLESGPEDPLGEWSLEGITLPLGQNDFAEESVRILRAKRTTAAVYRSRYKGIIGKVVRPGPSWAICVDSDGGQYYWNEAIHGADAALFALGMADCELIAPGSAHEKLMHWNLSVALYRRDHERAVSDFGQSAIPPLDLKSRLGI